MVSENDAVNILLGVVDSGAQEEITAIQSRFAALGDTGMAAMAKVNSSAQMLQLQMEQLAMKMQLVEAKASEDTLAINSLNASLAANQVSQYAIKLDAAGVALQKLSVDTVTNVASLEAQAQALAIENAGLDRLIVSLQATNAPLVFMGQSTRVLTAALTQAESALAAYDA